MDKYIQLDEEGYFHFDGQRVLDKELGHHLLSQLVVEPLMGYKTIYEDKEIYVEAFDSPLVVYQIAHLQNDIWQAKTPYEYSFEFSLNTLRADEWDRFLGYDKQNRPFVFTRSAQADFFNLVDSFDDDSVTFENVRYEVGPWLVSPVSTEPMDFWQKKYCETDKPGWELNKPSPPLVEALPQLKVNRSRILVPGCGTGNDAAFLAEQGHIVTAIDYCQEAIDLAKKKYGHIQNLKFVQADVFKLSESYMRAFDIVFEHTLFCAVPFEKRQNLVKVYRQCLADHGHLLGVFFVMEQKAHPPYGGSEWEYRQRFKNYFNFLYWTRWKKSESWRKGVELVIYAQLKERI